jgi:hypothetical protein
MNVLFLQFYAPVILSLSGTNNLLSTLLTPYVYAPRVPATPTPLSQLGSLW